MHLSILVPQAREISVAWADMKSNDSASMHCSDMETKNRDSPPIVASQAAADDNAQSDTNDSAKTHENEVIVASPEKVNDTSSAIVDPECQIANESNADVATDVGSEDLMEQSPEVAPSNKSALDQVLCENITDSADGMSFVHESVSAVAQQTFESNTSLFCDQLRKMGFADEVICAALTQFFFARNANTEKAPLVGQCSVQSAGGASGVGTDQGTQFCDFSASGASASMVFAAVPAMTCAVPSMACVPFACGAIHSDSNAEVTNNDQCNSWRSQSNDAKDARQLPDPRFQYESLDHSGSSEHIRFSHQKSTMNKKPVWTKRKVGSRSLEGFRLFINDIYGSGWTDKNASAWVSSIAEKNNVGKIMQYVTDIHVIRTSSMSGVMQIAITVSDANAYAQIFQMMAECSVSFGKGKWSYCTISGCY